MVFLNRQEVESLFLYAGISDTSVWSDALFLRRLKLMSLVMMDADVPDELQPILRTIRDTGFLDLRLGTPVKPEQDNTAPPKKSRNKCKHVFSFAFAGIPVGSVLTLSSNPKITCTVADDESRVSFADDVPGVDNTLSWTANTRNLLGYSSLLSPTPRRYWKYNGKVLDSYYQAAIKKAEEPVGNNQVEQR